MKLSRLTAVLFTAAALTGAVPAFAASSLLTPSGVRFTLVDEPESGQVQIARAEGDARATLVAPSTQDAAPESQAQLLYDSATDTLFVTWVRENTGNAEIRFAYLSAAGAWSSPRMIAAGSSSFRHLNVALTHAQRDGVTATLLHAAWWSVNGAVRDPEYALFAFEDGQPVSAEVANLNALAALQAKVLTSALEFEPDAIHPPLAMARNGEGVDIAFGAVDSTTLTRVNVVPKKIAGDVRIWKPVGRSSSKTAKVGDLLKGDTPAHAIIIDGRLALYAVDDDFRFIVLRADGTWSDTHSVHIDADNTMEDLVRDLRHTVQELLDQESTTTSADPSEATDR